MAYLNFLLRPWQGTGSGDNAEGAIVRVGGKHATKTITLSANNTSANVNVFQLTGVCEAWGIHGEVTLATTLTNCTNVYFDLWDGTNSVPITKTTGAVLSGYGVGSFMIKDSDVSSALTTLNNNQCRIDEASVGVKIDADLIMMQKLSTNTYIRFNYTTTDAPINAQIKIDLNWADIDNGIIVAV